MLGSGMNLITTAIGFGMSVTFIVFVCTRLICGRIRAADSRRMFEIEARIDLEQTVYQNQTRGLQPNIVAAIPTLKFNKDAFKSTDDTQCTICLGEYEEKEVLRIMPKCGHNFHLSCIDIWLRIQTTCPVCRLPLNRSVDRIHNTPAESGMYPSSVSRPAESGMYPSGVSRPAESGMYPSSVGIPAESGMYPSSVGRPAESGMYPSSVGRPAESGMYPSSVVSPGMLVENSQQILLPDDLQSEQDTDLRSLEVIIEVPQLVLREETR